jgi:phosphoribosylformylglycinamidine cyclo-ligase
MTPGAYARAGVDTAGSGRGVSALVEVLSRIDPGRPSRSVVPSGHYASVLRLDERMGIALTTDGVGSKVIVAERLGRFDTVGIDCVAMNVNDLVCVGAEPIAMLDYLAVEEADPETLGQIADGLRAGAEQAGVEIPGGELAQLPELIRGHPSPRGFDLVGACFGTVALDRLVLGDRIERGDAVIGVPSSGVHSNGLTLARRVLDDLDERPPALGGASVGETLLEPTVIYVRAVLDLLEDREVDVRGLAHITGDGLLNLLRLGAEVGYRVDEPLDPPPVFDLIADRLRDEDRRDLWEVFNMGCGLCVVVPTDQVDAAAAKLSERHPGARRVGEITEQAGCVELPHKGLVGRPGEGFRPA